MPPRFNAVLRRTALASRWCMAPLALGLIAAMLLVIAQFFRDLAHAIIGFSAMSAGDVIFAVLKLIDLMLVANLVLMIIGAACEIFLPMPTEDGVRADGSGIVEFAALKPRLFASISAIAAVDLLESFINIETMDKTAILWEILIMLAFVATGVLLALMERLAADRQ